MNPIDNGPKHRMSRDDDDDDLPGGGRISRDDKPKKGGMSTVAIVGLVIGGLLLCCCLSCGGWLGLNWTEFKKGFDEGFKKAQQQQKQNNK